MNVENWVLQNFLWKVFVAKCAMLCECCKMLDANVILKNGCCKVDVAMFMFRCWFNPIQGGGGNTCTPLFYQITVGRHRIGFVFKLCVWISVFRRKKQYKNPILDCRDIKQNPSLILFGTPCMADGWYMIEIVLYISLHMIIVLFLQE